MRLLSLLGVGLLAIAIGSAGSVEATADITGSDHDFTSEAWTDQICIVCHTPHNADLAVSDSPLWNHGVTAATFTPYDSATLDSTPGQPGGTSKLCLSCHDGTVAIDTFGGSTGTTMMTGDANFGTDLKDDHPIGFAFDAALVTADGELNDPTTTGLPLFGASADQLECATCHDVHNTSGFSDMLRLDNVGSALCLKCHDK